MIPLTTNLAQKIDQVDSKNKDVGYQGLSRTYNFYEWE